MAVPVRQFAQVHQRPEWSRTLAILLAVALSALLGVAMVKLGTVQRDLKAILIMAGALAMVIAALRPRIGVVVLLALMPFDYGFSGTGIDQVLIVATAAVLAWRIQWRAVPAWASIGGIALVLGSFASAIGAHDSTVALWGAVRWLGVLIVFFAVFTLLRDRRDASRRMIDIFTGSALVVAMFGLAQRAGIDILVGAPYLAGKPNSFFGYYTNYGGYVAMAATLATGELLAALGERRPWRALIYSGALTVLLVGLAISTSRGGLLALGVGWLLLLVLNLRRGSVLVQGVTILAVFTAAAYVATPRSTVTVLSERLTQTITHRADYSDKTRFALENAGATALATHPLGLGYRNFGFYLRGHVRTLNIRHVFAHAQNTPLQIGLDAGWVGLGGFMMLFLWPVGLVLVRGGEGPSSVRASAFAAALVGFMAQGSFDYLLYEIAFLAFFAALVWGTVHALSVDRQ